MLSVIAIFLVAIGLIALYSIEMASDQPNFFNFKKQLVLAGVGITLLIILSLIDYRYLRTYAWVFYGFGVAVMVALLFFGATIRGTKGWFVVFGQGFQPVELVKIILIITISKLLYTWRAEVGTIRQLLIVGAVAVPLIALVMVQPDAGSAMILLAIALGMLFLTKMKKTHVALVIILLLVVVILSWFVLLKGYQKERILTFFDPARDPWGSGYNIKQSIIAVGSGGLFGRGLGLGSQSRLNFLPAQETDFIFAVISESLGFVGAALLLICLGVLVYRLAVIAQRARDDFSLFLVCGIVIYLVAQAAMNIGMNVGLMPVAGVPLPFVSYGGSSLLMSFVAIGIAQSIRIRQIEKVF